MLTIDPSTPAVDPPLSQAAMTRFLNRARAAVGLVGGVEVLLTTDRELKRLNRTWRNKNKATDVLSFPAYLPEGFPIGPETHAGDLAISVETASRQAAAFGHSVTDELRVLLLHGLLHLSGLDHETDSGEMAAREAELRVKLKLPSSLIARVEEPTVKRAAKAAAKSVTKTSARPAKESALRGNTRSAAQAATKSAVKAGAKSAKKTGGLAVAVKRRAVAVKRRAGR